jgi:hypothetical protein
MIVFHWIDQANNSSSQPNNKKYGEKNIKKAC